MPRCRPRSAVFRRSFRGSPDRADADQDATAKELARALEKAQAQNLAMIEDLRTDFGREIAALQSAAASADTDAATREAELAARRAEREAELKARIASPSVVFDDGKSGGAGEAGYPMPPDAASGSRDAAGRDFVQSGREAAKVEASQVIAHPSNTVLQGTLIEATLENAVDSSLPGQLTAIVTRPVWSFDQAQVLIPAGSRLFGEYSSEVAIGQGRILVAWTRLVTPDGQSVQMEAFGGDAQGRSGITGRVNARFVQRFGSAALISLLGAAPAIAAASYSDKISSDTAEKIGKDLGSATGSAVDAYTSLPPIITVAPGRRHHRHGRPRSGNLVMDGQPSFLGSYLTPLAPLLLRDDLVEIAVNPDGAVWIERRGAVHMERVDHLRIERALSVNLGQAIASAVGVQFSERKPTVSGKITWEEVALRAQVIAPPIVEGGMALTLRPFKAAADQLIEPKLLHAGLIDLDGHKRERAAEVMRLAAEGKLSEAMRLCIEDRMNLLISGGTSTGKTSFARFLLESCRPARAHPDHRRRLRALPRPGEQCGAEGRSEFARRAHPGAAPGSVAADAARPDHPGRAARRGKPHLPRGDQHRARRLVHDDPCRQRAQGHRSAGDHGDGRRAWDGLRGGEAVLRRKHRCRRAAFA